MKVHIVRRLAALMNGADISRVKVRAKVDDVVDLPKRDAEMMIDEGWAVPLEPGDGPSESLDSKPKHST